MIDNCEICLAFGQGPYFWVFITEISYSLTHVFGWQENSMGGVEVIFWSKLSISKIIT